MQIKYCNFSFSGKAERVGAVQPGEEEALGRSYSSFPVSEGSLQKSWKATFYKSM